MNWRPSIFVLAAAFLAVFLEASLGVFRHWFGAQMDLLPALMVYTALTNGFATIVLLAVCGGLWFDSLSLNPLGASVLPLLGIGLLIYQSRDLLKELRSESLAPIARAAGVALSASASDLVLALYGRLSLDAIGVGGDRGVVEQLIDWGPRD